MKAEIKNIDYVWHAFFSDGTVLKSAGVTDIIDQVREAWPPIGKGYELSFEARETKFIVREVESGTKKLSKSDQSAS